MAKSELLDLRRFVARGYDNTSAPVCIPTSRFRIHPDRKRCMQDVYLSRAGDEWWLIDADVVEKSHLRIPKLWRADIFEGIWPNGRSFVLPVTFPVDCSHMDWYDSLSYAVKLARKQWVTVASDKENGRFDVTPEKKAWPEPGEWPKCEFAELVELAFFDHIILSREDAIAKMPLKTRRIVSEDFSE